MIASKMIELMDIFTLRDKCLWPGVCDIRPCQS